MALSFARMPMARAIIITVIATASSATAACRPAPACAGDSVRRPTGHRPSAAAGGPPARRPRRGARARPSSAESRTAGVGRMRPVSRSSVALDCSAPAPGTAVAATRRVVRAAAILAAARVCPTATGSATRVSSITSRAAQIGRSLTTSLGARDCHADHPTAGDGGVRSGRIAGRSAGGTGPSDGRAVLLRGGRGLRRLGRARAVQCQRAGRRRTDPAVVRRGQLRACRSRTRSAVPAADRSPSSPSGSTTTTSRWRSCRPRCCRQCRTARPSSPGSRRTPRPRTVRAEAGGPDQPARPGQLCRRRTLGRRVHHRGRRRDRPDPGRRTATRSCWPTISRRPPPGRWTSGSSCNSWPGPTRTAGHSPSRDWSAPARNC